MEDFASVIKTHLAQLYRLLDAPKMNFTDDMRGKIPAKGGVYCISNFTNNEYLYVGQSTNLRRRIFDLHLKGNRKFSVLKDKMIRRNQHLADEDAVEKFLKTSCYVQWLVIEDGRQRAFCEHFVVSVLRPLYND